MADYRLDCCGGFPTCVCKKRAAEAKQREESNNLAQQTNHTPVGLYEYRCNVCYTKNEHPREHSKWHWDMKQHMIYTIGDKQL